MINLLRRGVTSYLALTSGVHFWRYIIQASPLSNMSLSICLFVFRSIVIISNAPALLSKFTVHSRDPTRLGCYKFVFALSRNLWDITKLVCPFPSLPFTFSLFLFPRFYHQFIQLTPIEVFALMFDFVKIFYFEIQAPHSCDDFVEAASSHWRHSIARVETV